MKKQPNYNLAYFIKKFEAIPDDQWTTGTYKDNEDKCCALGHCGIRGSLEWNPTEEAEAFLLLIGDISATDINDGKVPEYQQLTPKARILAFLNNLALINI